MRNSMNNFALFDNSFDSSKTKTYYISIQLSLNGYSFSIIDTIWNKYIGLKHENFSEECHWEKLPGILKKIIANDDNLSKNYAGVALVLITRKSTLIPTDLFDKSNISLYYSYNHRLNGYEELRFNLLKKADAYNVFAVPQGIIETMNNRFSNVTYYQQATPFVENNLLPGSDFVSEKSKSVAINVFRDFFDIQVYRADKLLLFNSFEYSNKNDFVYYVLYIFKQLSLNPGTVRTDLSGLIDEKSLYYKDLKKYIANLSFSVFDNRFYYPDSFEYLPQHSFSNLLNLYKCV